MSHQAATPFPLQAGTHSRHNAVTQPFFHFSLTALHGRGENSSRRAGGHAGKRKAAFIADANINSARSQRVDRGAACPSIASVCVLHHRKRDGTGGGRGKPGRVVPTSHTNRD